MFAEEGTNLAGICRMSRERLEAKLLFFTAIEKAKRLSSVRIALLKIITTFCHKRAAAARRAKGLSPYLGL